MSQVPNSSPSQIQSLNKYGTPKSFQDKLIQITVGNYAVIYNIEDLNNVFEVRSLQSIDTFMSSDNYVDTGYQLSTSKDKYDQYGNLSQRIQNCVITNGKGDLFFIN